MRSGDTTSPAPDPARTTFRARGLACGNCHKQAFVQDSATTCRSAGARDAGLQTELHIRWMVTKAPLSPDSTSCAQNGPHLNSTGGITNSRPNTNSTISMGRSQRAHCSHGIFAMPKTAMVTPEVGMIMLV